MDVLGQCSYYISHNRGGRTVTLQYPGGNINTYSWNGRSAYQLDGPIWPAGVVTTSVSNALGLIGQNQQTLIEDKSIQPSDQISGLVANSAAPGQLLPAGAGLAGGGSRD